MHKELITVNNVFYNEKNSAPLDGSKQPVKHLVAIDLGSNSFHIIIAKEQDGCLQILYRQKSAVGLASGLDNHNMLSAQAIAKAVDCLREFNLSLCQFSSNAIRIVATHALRKAENVQYFIDEARKVLPYPIEVISGINEAELIYKGVAHTQHLSGQTLIIDIGGGSTELVIGSGFTHHVADSLEMGCVTFNCQFFSCGAITHNKIEQAQQYALQQLDKLSDKFQQKSWQTVLGTSGSIKAISQVMLELYGDSTISNERLNKLSEQLISWQHCESIPLRSLEPRRRPLLAGSVAILSSCFKWLNISQIHFSAGGVREGVLYDLCSSRTDIDPRERTVQNLINLHHIDQAFSHRILWQIDDFKSALNKTSISLTSYEFQLLNWSARLHEIGIAINSKKRQHHGAYIIEHSYMPGFSVQEQQIIALLILNHRGKLKLPIQHDFTIIPKQRLELLIQLLRLAVLLTQGRQQQRVTPCELFHSKNTLILALPTHEGLMNILNKEIDRQQATGLELTIKSITSV
jgi:exopolyphosphatase/guanosine-5'-triphosphate,3'-diphosphate pyrophosphatase